MKKVHKPSSTSEIIFSSSDLEGVISGHDDPMVILAVMVNAEVKLVFIDQGSFADIIFLDAFDKLKLKNFDLHTYKEELISFSKEKVYLERYITLQLNLGTRLKTRPIKIEFLVVDCPSTYNVILRRSTLNKIGAIISTTCLMMKFFTNKGEIAMIRADQAVARLCYNASMEI